MTGSSSSQTVSGQTSHEPPSSDGKKGSALTHFGSSRSVPTPTLSSTALKCSKPKTSSLPWTAGWASDHHDLMEELRRKRHRPRAQRNRETQSGRVVIVPSHLG